MNDLQPEEEQVLARARAALSPSTQDARRVFEATTQALNGASLGAATQSAGSSAIERALWSGGAVGRGKLLLVLAVSGLSGVYGYWLGFDAGRAASTSVAGPQRTVESPQAAPPAARDEVDITPSPASSPDATREAVIARVKKGAAPAAPARKLSLPEELEVLKRIERALRVGEPGLALELLDELDQREPAATLAQERAAASAAARCALGLGARAGLVEAFARAHPESVYLARVRDACRPP